MLSLSLDIKSSTWLSCIHSTVKLNHNVITYGISKLPTFLSKGKYMSTTHLPLQFKMFAIPTLVKMKEVAPMKMMAKDTVACAKTAILETIVTQVNVILTFFCYSNGLYHEGCGYTTRLLQARRNTF